MDVGKLKDDIISSFKDSLGESWEKMTEKDKELLEALAKDAAKLHLQNLTSEVALEKEIAIVNASLLNLTITKYFPVKKVFWRSVERVVKLALSALMKAAFAVL